MTIEQYGHNAQTHYPEMSWPKLCTGVIQKEKHEFIISVWNIIQLKHYIHVGLEITISRSFSLIP